MYNSFLYETTEQEVQLGSKFRYMQNNSVVYSWRKYDCMLFHNTITEINPEHPKWEENLPADWDCCVHKDM